MSDLNTNLILQLNGIANPSASSGNSFGGPTAPDDELGRASSQDNTSVNSFSSMWTDPRSNHIGSNSNHTMAPTLIASDNDDDDTSMPSAVTAEGSSGVSNLTLTPSRDGVLNQQGAYSMIWHPTLKLNEYYQKKYRKEKQVIHIKENFVSWPRGPLNNLEWTAVFVCPLSGECFSAGTLRNDPCVRGGSGVCWYKTKNLARKAAAGRAVDCWTFRTESFPLGVPLPGFCQEEPYEQDTMERRRLDIPNHVPLDMKHREILPLQNAAVGGAFL